jgi:uncharacterized coiled-coil DUF342 family protein
VPDWLIELLKLVLPPLLTGGGLTVIFGFYLKRQSALHKQELARAKQARADRGDEIDVLHQEIVTLRTDRDAFRKELNEYRAVREKDFNDLKDEHTACLIEQDRLRSAEEYQRLTNEALTKRITKLEADVAQLSGVKR